MTPQGAPSALAAALGDVELSGDRVPVHVVLPARWAAPAVFIAPAEPWLMNPPTAPWNVFTFEYRLRLYVAAGDPDKQMDDLAALVATVVRALLATPDAHPWEVSSVSAPTVDQLDGMGPLLGCDVTVSATYPFT